MPFYKRAILYLIRKKYKSILLILILFIMSSFVLTGLTLKNSADKEIKSFKDNLGSSFILKVDIGNPDYYEYHTGENGIPFQTYKGPIITKDMIQEISSLPNITKYSADYRGVIWVDLKLKPGLWAENVKEYAIYPERIPEYISYERVVLTTQIVIFIPCVNGNLHENFRMGAFTIAEGRNIQDNDHFTAVISSDLAKRNGLSLGDTFYLETKVGVYRPSENPFERLGDPIPVKIVGLFNINFKQEFSFPPDEVQYVENLIFTDMDVHNQMRMNIHGSVSEKDHSKVTFFVDNSENLSSVLDQVKGLSDMNMRDYILQQDDTAYRASIKPLRQINILSVFLILVGTLGCIIILYLVLKIWAKERTREIGIFLSLGKSRFEIILQMILECIVLTLFALLLTLFLSKPVITGVSLAVESMVQPDKEAQAYITEYGMIDMLPVINKVSSDAIHLDYNLSLPSALFMVLITCPASAGSVILVVFKTVHIKPKELLATM